MGSFSFGDAIGAGFRVIGRQPLALLAWAAVYLVFVVAPTVATLAYVVPSALASFPDIAAHAGHPDPARMLAMQSRIFGWQPGLWLLQVVTNTVVMGAIFRAVLEPQSGRWGYLRLSRQELWLGLTYLVIMVMSVIMFLVLCIPIAIGAGVMAAIVERSGEPGIGGVLLFVLASLAGSGVVVWVLLRLCLALPMSFSQGRFLLYESWDLTRGQAFRMFLVFLTLMIGVLLVEGVVAGALALSLVPRVTETAAWSGADLASILNAARRMAPAIGVGVVVGSAIVMAIHTVLVAPLAAIYRELSGDAAV